MYSTNLGENIIKLRHKKGITQEELANFIGVTKSSVSKWENNQSLPDILLLPQLASLFDVTIDDLIGYKANLSKEQIRKIYYDLASDFATLPFEDVIQKSQSLVKKYYSCYPFLLQICALWFNHFMVPKDQKRQIEILKLTSDLCTHIISNCKDVAICNNTIYIKSSIDLQLGNSAGVIDTLEDILNPYNFNQSDCILIQAYNMANNKEKAISFTQISMFLHLMNLINNAIQYIDIHKDNLSICENIINRIDGLIDIFKLEKLNANITAIFNYQACIIYCINNNKEKALQRIEKYFLITQYLLSNNNILIHSDDFFSELDTWYENTDLGVNPPRNKKFITESVIQALNNPYLSLIQQEERVEKIKNIFIKRSDNL